MSQISDSGRKALIQIAQRLREGFSGEIRLVCKDGGVRFWDDTQRHFPSDVTEEDILRWGGIPGTREEE